VALAVVVVAAGEMKAARRQWCLWTEESSFAEIHG